MTLENRRMIHLIFTGFPVERFELAIGTDSTKFRREYSKYKNKIE